MNTPHDSSITSPETETGDAATTPRRGFLIQAVTAIVSTLIVAVPSVIGGLFFLDPLLRKKKSGEEGNGNDTQTDADGFIRIGATASSLPEDGKPVAVSVIANLDDAWNRFMNVPVGSVWLRKAADGSIQAFNSICPHLGCSVNYRRSENDFFCPCHTSAFDLDGNRTNEVPPRDMDTLEIRRKTAGAEDPDGDELWVKYVNFRRTTEEKIPL